jgi:type I restriction enzyme, S subunit
LFITEKILHECDFPITCASFCRFLRVNPELAEPEFVFWYLQFLYGTGIMVNYQVQHTGVARFQYTTFAENVEIPLPPLAEQRAIAEILGSLDDKIEANRRQNETLEATARAIFKSWFVDFDPVHAKSRGEHPPGMDAEMAALFPDSFEDSELGLIPRGWGVKSLDEIATYLNGLALQKYPAEDETDFLPVIKIRELRQGAPDDSSNRASTTIPPAYIVNDGDVLFSWSGSLLVDIWTGGKGALNQHLFKVISDRYPRWLYYFWTLFYLDEFIQIAADKATTMGHIKRHHLSDSLVVIPNDDILPVLTAHIEPYIEAMVNNRIESRTLAETRDALLPRLVSGSLRVGDL